MATEKCAAGSEAQTAIDARLDAIDRLLLGFIPRHERVSIVRDLEERLHTALSNSPFQSPAAIAAGGAASLADLPPDALSSAQAIASSGWESAVGPVNRFPLIRGVRRSKLAVAAAILGMVACMLLMGMPIAYFAMSIVGEMLDETGMILTLSTYMLAMLLGGGGAIVLGTAALWTLRHQQSAVTGRGWAVTGLCTGPLPFAIASLLVVCWGLPMLGEMGYLVQPVIAVAAPPESAAASNASAEVRQISENGATCASPAPAKPSPASAKFIVAQQECSSLPVCPATCTAPPKSATPAPTAAKMGNVPSPMPPEERPPSVSNPEPASASSSRSPASD